MNKIASRAGVVLLMVLLLIAGLIFFLAEYVIQSDEWVTFRGSPHVYNGDNIGCGKVVDREGVLLLDLNGERTYSDSEQLRLATVHWLGDRKGNISAPALSNYATELAGYELLNGVYAYGSTGAVAELTLSSQVQITALKALGDYKGTIAVYNYKTGELICAVTTPTFDPDNAPKNVEDNDRYEGVYLNRFVQSCYTPGSIFKIVTLAAALESMPDALEKEFFCGGSCEIGADIVTCDGRHGKQNLKQAFRNSCNCAFAQLALEIGADKLENYVQQFRITESVTFDGITTSKGTYDLTDAARVNVAWSSIGQYTDLVNPCAYLTFVGAIANGGKSVMPHLVQRVSSGGISGYSARTVKGERLMSQSTADTVKEFMGFNVTDKYGSDNFPGLKVCAKTGTAEVGGNKKPNAVFTGFVEDSKYPLAFIAIVEDGGYGRQICLPMVAKVLESCKQVMD